MWTHALHHGSDQARRKSLIGGKHGLASPRWAFAPARWAVNRTVSAHMSGLRALLLVPWPLLCPEGTGSSFGRSSARSPSGGVSFIGHLGLRSGLCLQVCTMPGRRTGERRHGDHRPAREEGAAWDGCGGAGDALGVSARVSRYAAELGCA